MARAMLLLEGMKPYLPTQEWFARSTLDGRSAATPQVDRKVAAALLREPDGVPHAVVGFTALFSVILALLVACMLIATPPAAIAFALIAVPWFISSLARKAERERDVLHPSR